MIPGDFRGSPNRGDDDDNDDDDDVRETKAADPGLPGGSENQSDVVGFRQERNVVHENSCTR